MRMSWKSLESWSKVVCEMTCALLMEGAKVERAHLVYQRHGPSHTCSPSLLTWAVTRAQCRPSRYAKRRVSAQYVGCEVVFDWCSSFGSDDVLTTSQPEFTPVMCCCWCLEGRKYLNSHRSGLAPTKTHISPYVLHKDNALSRDTTRSTLLPTSPNRRLSTAVVIQRCRSRTFPLKSTR